MDVAMMLTQDEQFMRAFCDGCPETGRFNGDDVDPSEDCCPCDFYPFDDKCPKSADLNRAVDLLERLV